MSNLKHLEDLCSFPSPSPKIFRDDLLGTAKAILADLQSEPDFLNRIDSALDSDSCPNISSQIDAVLGYVGSANTDDNMTRLNTVFDGLAQTEQGLVPFDEFAEKVEQNLTGIVMTAHPTFTLSNDAWHAAKSMLHTRIENGADGSSCEKIALVPTASPSLEDELAYANEAIVNARCAIRLVWKAAIETAQKLYPDNWQKLSPTLTTIASWVGFDLDGRTDINWSQSLRFRYITTLQGLEQLTEQLQPLLHDPNTSQVAAEAGGALSALTAAFSAGLEALDVAEKEDDFAAFNRAAIERRQSKESARLTIDQALEKLLNSDAPIAAKTNVAVFRSEWKTIGLGLSHIHFRLNAAQLHNAIRPLIKLKDAPDRSASRRHYLQAISDLLAEVDPLSVHYGNVADEMTTAKRVFMLAAQFRKHFDDNSSLRMLVAESDTPFTLLVALYYAKQFGIDDYIEISPLFETAIGLQRGDRVIAELLDNPEFAAYVEKQGRFCVQLGFSDSGRYIGQIAASLAIERFKLKLIRLWEARGLNHIQLVFFDTHGESIGRGAHPASMHDRFMYTHSPEVRRRLNDAGNAYKQEVSFQGGDGYFRFLHPDLALATFTDLIEARFEDTSSSKNDALYTNSDWSLDFFLTLTEFHEDMVDDNGYVRLVDSIGPALLYPTGSRAVKRQGRGRLGQRLESISQIRAIPNNAVLQQLGFMANSAAGLGSAANRNPRRFSDVASHSPRLRSLLGMGQAALRVSDPGVMAAYLSCLSPSYWLDRCGVENPSKERGRMLRLSKALEGVFDGNAMRMTLRKFRRDTFVLEDMLETTQSEKPAFDQGVLNLHILRLALIQFIFLKSMEIPQFSSRQDVSLQEYMSAILHLNVDGAIDDLRAIFPMRQPSKLDQDYGEPSTFEGAQINEYGTLHETVLDPMEQAHKLLLKITSLIAVRIGAVG